MKRRSWFWLVGLVAGFFVLLIGGRIWAGMFTDILWFRELGYSAVYWKRILAEVMVRTVTGAVGAVLVLVNLWFVVRHLGPVHLRRRYGNLEIAEQVPRRYVNAGIVATAVLAGWWLSGIRFGSDPALAVLAWLHRPAYGVADPLFGRDLSFYIFTLPVLAQLLDYLFLAVIWSLLLVGIGYVLVGSLRVRNGRIEVDEAPRLHFALLVAALVLLLAGRYWLGRYGILLDGTGFGGAVGFTDVHARLPAHIVMTFLCVAAAGAIVFGAIRRLWGPPALAIAVLVVAAVGVGFLYPAFIQKLRVEPNQIAREEPYIRWNIQYTLRAFGLADMERRDYPFQAEGGSDRFVREASLGRLPLWDRQPLRQVYNQVQTFTPYYHFDDVDYDRYGPPGDREQVGIGVREFAAQGLTPDARTWRTLHLNPQYTRGYGAVVSPASETVGAAPVYWLTSYPRGIPGGDSTRTERDAGAPPGLRLRNPSVYFGESPSSGEYVVLNGATDSTRQAAGTDSAALEPAAGVPLTNYLRVVAFAWRFNDRNLLFSSERTDRSRLIFRRQIITRVGRLAPWVVWDRDAYPVIVAGHIVWLLDGYTISTSFPLSRPYSIGSGLLRVRYVRNSVKATVDAVSGEVRLYANDDEDPILRAYRNVFPNLVQPLSALPGVLRQHLRYPPNFLRLQADVLDEYHLQQPDAFFAGQDVWQLPAAATGPSARSWEPLFLMARLPHEPAAEFLLMIPFVARDRQIMTGLLVVRNDGGHYGEKILYELPREQQIKGPAQVQTILEQDPAISAQLSLWRAAGSSVEMGNLRVVPVDSALLYVQPLYLLSQNQNPIPQLQRVAVSDGNSVAMATTLPQALASLAQGGGAVVEGKPAAAGPGAADTGVTSSWPNRALQLLEDAEQHLRDGDWAGFGTRWNELKDLLKRIAEEGSSGS